MEDLCLGLEAKQSEKKWSVFAGVRNDTNELEYGFNLKINKK